MKENDVATRKQAHGIKKTVRLTADTAKAIREVGGPEVNWSAGVNSIVDRYKLLIKHNLPALKQYEEIAIAKVFKNHVLKRNDMEAEILLFHSHISNALTEQPDIVELLGKDYDMSGDSFLASDHHRIFLKKIKCWSFSEKMAVLHKAMSCWTKSNNEWSS